MKGQQKEELVEYQNSAQLVDVRFAEFMYIVFSQGSMLAAVILCVFLLVNMYFTRHLKTTITYCTVG